MIPSESLGLGSTTQFSFFLDSSLKDKKVTIQKPFFSKNPDYDFNDYVSCISPSTIPVELTGLDHGAYYCTQTSYLKMKEGDVYDISASLSISCSDGETLTLSDLDYSYDPWNFDKVYKYIFLITEDSSGNLVARQMY